jgi:hypothetical protein
VFDEAGRGELAESFAHRRARNPKTLGEFLLVEPLARSEAAAKDFVGERRGELRGARLTLRVRNPCAEAREKRQIRYVHARSYAH